MKPRTVKHCGVFLSILVLCLGVTIPLGDRSALAVTASDWHAGQIIDDSIFYNSSDMSVAQVQDFLNNKVPTCDTWGTQPSEYGGGTRAQYGASRGFPAPYTCLKDYYENPTTHANNLNGNPIPGGGMSAAQIIVSSAQTYSISVRALLTTLEKESSGPLITDTWPFPTQYTNAMGYGCPDTAPCDPSYAGLYNQINNAARQFALYKTSPENYRYKPDQNNSIQYNPNAACGASTVFVQGYATAGLYNYTPYQPNAAALAAGYGTGDSCSAYGNRNFWLIFNDTFGPTIYDVFPWSVETVAGGDGKYWLIVGNTKRWIPDSSIYADWGLNNYPLQQVSQQALDSIPSIPNLGHLGYTKDGQYVFVDAGKKWILSSPTATNDWGYAGTLNVAAPLYSVLSNMPTAGNANQFVQTVGTQTTYLMSNGILYPINSSYVSRWNISNVTTLSSNTTSQFTISSQLDYRLSAGGKNYLVDSGGLLDVTSVALANAYGSIASSFVGVDTKILPFFDTKPASQLVQASNATAWDFIVGGRQYYVPDANTARAWGGGTQPQVISPVLLAQLTSNGTLGTQVHATDSDKYYLVDGTKHTVAPSMVPDWIGSAAAMQLLDVDVTLPQGSDITTPLFQVSGTPNIYTSIDGKYYYIQTGNILDGYGYPHKYPLFNLNSRALSSLVSGGAIGQFLVNNGTTYYLQAGIAYAISPGVVSSWTNGTVPSYLGTDFKARFTPQPTPLTNLISDSSQSKWLVDNGSLISVSTYADAFSFTTWSNIDLTDLPRSGSATYLARSSTSPTDSRVWLINKGTKQWITSLGEFDGLGGSKLATTRLSDATLAGIPNAMPANDPSIIIRSGSSGLKLLVNGQFYAFPDADTVTSLVGTNAVTDVSSSIYNSINQQAGTVSRLLQDTSTQKIYHIENGQKRWITNGTALMQYANTPVTKFPSEVINWFPEGSNIN